MVWTELQAICLCNKELDFIFLFNRFVVYSLPATMNFLTGNYTIDLFYLLKENFKNLLSDLLITERSFENLSYLSNCSLSQRWRFRRIRSNVLRGIESNLAYKKVSGSLWHPLSSSMLKNERIFLLVISKLMSAFSVWLYNLV